MTSQAMIINGYHVAFRVEKNRYCVSPYRCRPAPPQKWVSEFESVDAAPYDARSATEMRDLLFADEATALQVLAEQIALSETELEPQSGYGWADGYEVETLEAEGHPNIWRIFDYEGAEPELDPGRRVASIHFPSQDAPRMLSLLTESCALRVRIGLPRDLPVIDRHNVLIAA